MKGENRSMRKSVSLILILVLVLTSFTVAFAEPLEIRNIYQEAGNILESAGMLQGDSKGDLMLNKQLKRQDMVVLISRLMKSENIASKYPGKVQFNDVKDSYYKPYIAWSVNQGLIVGRNSKVFGFNDPVTVQELQTLLLRTLGYTEEAKDWDNVPRFAEGLGMMEDLNVRPKDKVSRGLMAKVTLNSLRLYKKGSSITLAKSLDITIPDAFNVSAIATVNNDTLKLEGLAQGTNNLKVEIKPLSKDIPMDTKQINIPLKSDGRFSIEIPELSSGNYSYRFISGNYYTKYEDFAIKELPFEITDVKAPNLKEIFVSFTKPVDKSTALILNNYSTDAGSIKKIRTIDNDKTVVITLADNIMMKNQNKYNLSIYKIKSAKGEELSLKNKTFETFDNEPPKVVDIKQLGNKAIKIYFSEPIKKVSSTNFKIDGKNFIGNVRLEDNIVFLTPYNSGVFTEGNHYLIVSKIEDYAGYRGIEDKIDFSIVKDTTPPQIVDGRATLEKAIITFDEDIDPNTVSRTNFYWKSGNTKRYPSKVEVGEQEVILDFSKDKLPGYTISLFVDGIADYSGNKLKNGEIKITPTIDRTNPEVISATPSEDGKSIKIIFSKNVEGRNRNCYTIRDKDGKNVNIRDISGSGREYSLNLYSPLPVGTNTLIIQGVYDTTALKNIMTPYTTTIEMKDVVRPKVTSHSGKGREIIIQFSKEMDINTLEDPNNYLITFNKTTTFLPKDTEFNILNDGQTLIIQLPETINGKEVKIGESKNLTKLQIMRIQDTIGNYLEPDLTILEFNLYTTGKTKALEATLTEENIIQVKFNQPIVSVSPYDFSISGRTICDAICDGTNIISIILDSKNETTINSQLVIKTNNNIMTMIDTTVEGKSLNIVDKVSPRVKDDITYLKTYDNTIELPFTEELEKEGDSLYRRDLEIIRLSDGHILEEYEYSTYLSKDKKILIISLDKEYNSGSQYAVRIKDPIYIRDTSGNITLESNQYYTY